MTVFLVCLIVAVTIAVSGAARGARARTIAANRRAEDAEYLEVCLNRKRSHDFPLSDLPSRDFEESFWRGWNR